MLSDVETRAQDIQDLHDPEAMEAKKKVNEIQTRAHALLKQIDDMPGKIKYHWLQKLNRYSS